MKCDFEALVKLLDKGLDVDPNVDEKLQVLCHLDHCTTCREAVYQITRDRDAGLYVKEQVRRKEEDRSAVKV